jgi:microcystin degradation protein MlrC
VWSELRERVAQYNSRTGKMSDVEKSHGWTVRDIPDQSGRIVVVTGANSGSGYEAALALAAAGAHVVAAARNEEKADEIESPHREISSFVCIPPLVVSKNEPEKSQTR